MQNYHRHSCYSNIFTADSSTTNEDYAKRAVELGHKIISSVEHGWQGYYFETFELAKKYNLKFIFGTEAYWVKDRHEKDRTNGHIIILAKNENGRQAINDILSTASEDGYYFKPRVDLELLLSLPPNDVFITTACVAFWQYEDIEEIVVKLHNYFKENFMLEIQYHNTKQQIDLNKKILYLADKYDIEMIVGLDSHYIYPEEAIEREYVLESKNIHYDNEDEWYMDYPDDKTIFQRFKEQNIFADEQIQRAMNNTDICLSFEDYDDVPIFNKEIKLPTLYPNLSQEEKNKLYSRLITKKFKEYMKNVPSERYQEYFDGVKMEVQTYKDTGMVDYPLLDYEIVKEAISMGGLITSTGRGSAVGYFTNTLCGFSKVDRFTSAIKLYPERFISTTRILETKSLPDIDLNVGTPEIFEQAQINVLGQEHVYPMIAFGTFKKKSAFKLYARAKNLDFSIANEISSQIEKYEEVYKYADDDVKDEIDIYDYIDEKYRSYIEASSKYLGIISDKKKAPCSYLLYQGDIRREIGLIKCKSESTKKECITCVIDGAIAENYKFLKNDILKVDVVLSINRLFDRINISPFDINTLIKNVENDDRIWDLYAKGYTVGLNQVERKKDNNKNPFGTVNKVKKYKPKNISELTAFIAAIRPGFASMYSKFESREDFSWGIPTLDNLIRTKELPVSFLFFQEQVMSVLNYAGFPMDECYGIIKAIAKKHPEKVKPLKTRFINGFKQRLIENEGLSFELAESNSEKVWQIIKDNCGYSFNSSHAYCMALDSLYSAWQKVNYPYEFYEVMLNHYTQKGNKEKVAWFKEEMKKAFGINEGKYKWGLDNRQFVADKINHCINPSLVGIKGIGQNVANHLYEAEQSKKYNNLYEIFSNLRISSDVFDILIKINYFEDFGSVKKILNYKKAFDELNGRKQFNKKDVAGNKYIKYIVNNTEETETLYRKFNSKQALNEIWNDLQEEDLSLTEKLCIETEYLGYPRSVISSISPNYAFIQTIKGNTSRMVQLYRLSDGSTESIKVRKKAFDSNPFKEGQIIKTIDCAYDKKWKYDKELEDKTGNGYYQIDEKEPILMKWSIVEDD